MLKSFLSVLMNLLTQARESQDHKRVFTRFCLVLVGEIVAFSLLFHVLMLYEGREYSLVTGFYWTLTVMSTLGFGDITFVSDLGKLFSIVVLMSGIVFFLILLPFTFIQHFYIPWMEKQKNEMVPRSLPDTMQGHVLIAGINPISLNLAATLSRYDMPVYLLCGDMATARELIASGHRVLLGDHDDKETYRKVQAHKAACLVVMDTDIRSANIVFSAHEAAPDLPIVAGVETLEGRDILRMAGCTRCFHFYSLLGEALARRVITPSQRVSVLGHFGRLAIAEAPVMRTPLAGQTLVQSGLRQDTGVSAVGVWERGVFTLPRPDTKFGRSTVLMVAGTEEQMEAFNRLLSSTDKTEDTRQPPILIIGGGRVGVAVARSLMRRGTNVLIVDRNPAMDKGSIPFICGEASDLGLMEKAGIRNTPSIIVTTHDDDANIYLTIYCRRIRPDVQIICRASLDKNVNGLHLAGADLVLSLASLVSSTVINLLSPNRVLMLNERLAVFRTLVQENLAGKTLAGSGIRNKTHCSVLAVHSPDGTSCINPPAGHELKLGDTVYLIGDTASQNLFKEHFGIVADSSTDAYPQWNTAAPGKKPAESRDTAPKA